MRPLPAQVDLPALERRVLQRWADGQVFERSLEQTADGEPWVFYEGPPTANGKPGTHHVEARVFKDLFPRFKTMQGRSVPRRAGWDCHGLPVELAVEKELGFTGKGDIEQYGVAEFNARCRESVGRHVDEFERLTERMGYWVDMSAAYRTMDSSYVQSVWWSLKQIADKGLLVEDHRVAPYCPRCGTALSDHEVAQGYQDVVDPSRLRALPGHGRPAVGARRRAARLDDDAVDAGLQHRGRGPPDGHLRRRPRRRRGARRRRAAAGGARRGRRGPRPLPRHARSSTRRTRARSTSSTSRGAHFVGTADYVTTDSGTGLVHQSPAFGADDMAVARRYGLPVVNPVRPDGTFEEHLPLVGGQFFKAADRALVDRPRGARAAVPRARVRAQLPALLALRHRAALLRAAQLVHPHHRGQGPPASRRTSAPTGTRRRSSTAATATGSTTTSTGRCRATATGAPRCRSGAAPPTPRTGRRTARSPSSARPPARSCPRSTRTGPTSTTSSCPASAAASRPAACRRSSTAGTTPARCRSRRSATRTAASSRPTRRSSSARRSTRRAAGSTRSWPSGRWCSTAPRTRRCSASGTSSTATAAR